jgi:hypothetical protein
MSESTEMGQQTERPQTGVVATHCAPIAAIIVTTRTRCLQLLSHHRRQAGFTDTKLIALSSDAREQVALDTVDW